MKWPKMCKILAKIIKLTFAVIALVIEIHDCLTLSKTFDVVYGTFKPVTKPY